MSDSVMQAAGRLEDSRANDSTNEHFDAVLAARLSRRSLLKGSFGLAATTFFGAAPAGCASGDDLEGKALRLNFDAVAKSRADAVVVPTGHTAQVLFRLGDPMAGGVADFRNDGTDGASTFVQRAGDHHDGMHYFGMGSDGRYNAGASERGLLVMNHEALRDDRHHAGGWRRGGRRARIVGRVALAAHLAAGRFLCAEHVQQLGGVSPLSSLMAVKD